MWQAWRGKEQSGKVGEGWHDVAGRARGGTFGHGRRGGSRYGGD